VLVRLVAALTDMPSCIALTSTSSVPAPWAMTTCPAATGWPAANANTSSGTGSGGSGGVNQPQPARANSTAAPNRGAQRARHAVSGMSLTLTGNGSGHASAGRRHHPVRSSGGELELLEPTEPRRQGPDVAVVRSVAVHERDVHALQVEQPAELGSTCQALVERLQPTRHRLAQPPAERGKHDPEACQALLRRHHAHAVVHQQVIEVVERGAGSGGGPVDGAGPAFRREDHVA